MSKRFVISDVPNATARSIGSGLDYVRCLMDIFFRLVNVRVVCWSIAMLFCFISVEVRGSDEKIQAAEHRALIAAANAESAYFQRENIHLIAPEVRQQIQDISDQISQAAGADRHFRVFVLNEGFLSTQSSANGDIYITTGYLDMVEDRDELAFGLAREIAMQVKDMRLKEMHQQLQDARKTNRINLVFNILVGSAVGAVYGTYALGPINNAIYRNTARPQLVGIQMVAGKSTVTAGRGPGGLIEAPSASGPQMEPKYGQDFSAESTAKQGTGIVDHFVNWLPTLINTKILAVTSRMVNAAFEDADPERRKLKNQLGFTFMQMAGYDSASGQKVVKKIDDYWASTSSTNTPSTNAPPKNELK